YTFSANSNPFDGLLAIWKSTDNFGKPYDLTLSVDGRSLFIEEIHPNIVLIYFIFLIKFI
ncbi:unnamed protein product, partial [Rotaria sp. Silwood2]